MTRIGFIGLGVMGGPMCRNIAVKHDGPVTAFDLNPAAFAGLDGTKARRADSVAEVAAQSDIVFLSLPGGPQVEQVCLGPDGLAAAAQPPRTIVDLSTTPVATARRTAEKLAERGTAFADAPVARTREAAQKGQLSIMVGADPALFGRIEPLLRYIGTDVTFGGPVGSGQVLKLVNNALLFQNVVAIAEMMVLAERAGVPAATMIEAVSKGSGDSFALRNHATRAMAPRDFPEKSFPPAYVLKDLSYVTDLAAALGVAVPATETAARYYARTAEIGYDTRYFPAVIEVVARGAWGAK